MKNEKLILDLIEIKNDLMEKGDAMAQMFDSDCVMFLDPTIEKIVDICYELLQEEIEELPENMPDQVAEIFYKVIDSKNTITMINDLFN